MASNSHDTSNILKKPTRTETKKKWWRRCCGKQKKISKGMDANTVRRIYEKYISTDGKKQEQQDNL